MKKNVKINMRYCCPHCLTVHVKDPATQMLCSNADEGLRGVYHLDVVERRETIRCRTCQQVIDYQRLLKGSYDYPNWPADAACVTGLALLAALHWFAGWSWPASIAAASVLTLAIGMGLSRWLRLRIRARMLTR